MQKQVKVLKFYLLSVMYCKCILFQLDIRKYYVLQKKLFLPYFSTSLLTGDAKVVPNLDVM